MKNTAKWDSYDLILKTRYIPRTKKQRLIRKKLEENFKNNSSFRNLMMIVDPQSYQSSIRDVKRTIDKNDKQDKLSQKEKGYYLNIFNQRFETGTSHSPGKKADGSWVGVEIECLIPCGDLFPWEPEENDSWEDKVYEYQQTLRKMLKDKRNIPFVQVKNDGSLNEDEGNFFSAEFCVLTTGDMKNLKDLCDFLKSLGAYVDKSCGLHVHLDLGDIKSKYRGRSQILHITRRANNLHNAMGALKQMLPWSRQTNETNYCADELPSRRGSKYKMVNLLPCNKYGTIEVRAHSGTVNYTKISHWIRILRTIAYSNVWLRDRVGTLEELFVKYNFPLELQEYMISRAAKFRTPGSVDEETAA